MYKINLINKDDWVSFGKMRLEHIPAANELVYHREDELYYRIENVIYDYRVRPFWRRLFYNWHIKSQTTISIVCSKIELKNIKG
jgi:hypothetical protein